MAAADNVQTLNCKKKNIIENNLTMIFFVLYLDSDDEALETAKATKTTKGSKN